MRQATDVREQATGHSVKKAPPRLTLSCSGHHCTKDIVNACRIALSVPLEPFIDVAIQAGSHQHFRRPADLRQLRVAQWRDIRVVDTRIVSGGLTLGDASQDRLLRLIRRLAEDRFGAHADSLPAPR